MASFKDRLKQKRRRCARCLERCCTRLQDAVLNPEAWYSSASTALSKWVRRSVVMSFGISETVLSMVLMIPFLMAPQLGTLGIFLASFQSMMTLLVIRAASGVLGTIGACLRKVSRTKIYFGAMIANIVLSGFVAQPVMACTCSCKNQLSRQCLIVRNFVVWVQHVHALRSSSSDGEAPGAGGGPQRRASLGTPEPSTRLFSNFSADPLSLQPLGGASARTWRRLAKAVEAASERPRRRLKVEEPYQVLDHIPGEPMTDEQVTELLEKYRVTDAGIGWPNMSDATCTTVEGSLFERGHMLRKVQLRFQCSGPDGDYDPEIIQGFRDLDPLQEYLDFCDTEPHCEVVEMKVELLRGGKDAEVPYKLSLCRYESIVPALELSESDSACWCRERCVVEDLVLHQSCDACQAMSVYFKLTSHDNKKSELDVAVKELAEFYCRMAVSFTLSCLALLDALALLMTVVVYAFMRNRCGDVFVIEDQFQVDHDSTLGPGQSRFFNADDDDFEAVDLGRGANITHERSSCTSEEGAARPPRGESVQVEMAAR